MLFRDQPKHLYFLAVVFLVSSVLASSMFRVGLFSDPALYASFFYKISQGMSLFDIQGSVFFKQYTDHPPFFFAWGSVFFRIFGESEFVSRLAGLLPVLAALSVWIWWLLNRWAQKAGALVFALLVLSWGHFTKYVTAPWLETFLSLGMSLIFISASELFYFQNFKQKFWKLGWALGFLLVAMSKGIIVGGPLFAMFVFFLVNVLRKPDWAVFKTFFFYGSIALLCSFIPFAIWHVGSVAHTGESAVELYFTKQVLKSFFTNRGENLVRPEDGDLFAYVKLIVKYSFLYFGLAIYAITKKHPLSFLNGLFFGVLFIAFSLSTVQLPHYLHPIYLPTAFMAVFAPDLSRVDAWISQRVQLSSFLIIVFAVAASVGIYVQQTGKPLDRTDRGLGFYQLSLFLDASKNNSDSRTWLLTSTVDENKREVLSRYDFESFGGWYLRNHKWQYCTDCVNTADFVLDQTSYSKTKP